MREPNPSKTSTSQLHTNTATQFAYTASDTRAQIDAGVAESEHIGISVFAIAPNTDTLDRIQTLPSDNAFYFAFDTDQTHLYAVNAIADYAGGSNGSIEAYTRDPATGLLTFLNRVDSGGGVPAQPIVSPSGKWVIAANYSGANVTVLPILPDGSVGDVASVVERTGTGPDTSRQDQSRPHAAIFDSTGNYLAIADLGTDEVVTYALDDTTGQLTAICSIQATPGSGPRHLAFAPSGTILYVLTEMADGIEVYAYDPTTGMIGALLQSVSAIPEPFTGTKSGAEILIHPSGRFLYNSNRGQPDTTTPEGDAIVGWRIDPDTGLLTLIDHMMEGIGQPWSFAFDRTGTWLYAANYTDSTITRYAIDSKTGELTFTGDTIPLPHPFVIQTSA